MRAALVAALSAVALHCSVYSTEDLVNNGQGGASGQGGATTAGAGGSAGDRPDASTGGTSGSGGSGGASGATTGGASGKGGVSGGGSGGTFDATGGSDGGADADSSLTGGAGGSSGSAGASGASGTSGAAGANVGGAAGASGNGGAAGSMAGAGGTDPSDGSTDASDATDAPSDTVPPVGAVFAVGTFTSTATTGTQVVSHPLGQNLKALILWTMGKTNEVLGSNYYYGLGVSDMFSTVSFASSSKDEVSPSSSSRRVANRVMTLVQGGEVTMAEADLVASDSSTFTLNWTLSDSQPYIVHYIAIGGPQVMAKLVNWQTPASPAAKAITVGFSPSAVLHFHAGASVLNAPPTSLPNSVVGIGAMDQGGMQWGLQVAEASGVTEAIASRAQHTSSAIFMYNDTNPATVSKEASIASMMPDGFNMNFTQANANLSQVVSLALGGVKARVGSFDKTTAAAPASQTITTDFRPGAVFLASYQRTSTTNVREFGSALGIGASDGVREASSIFGGAHGVTTTATTGQDKTGKVFLKMNDPPLDAEADLTAMTPTGFTLNWTLNDGVASQICYIALGAP